MFTADSEEWVIAESPQDARDVYCKHIGHEPMADDEDPDDGDSGMHVAHWEQLPDEKPLTLRTECDAHHKVDVQCSVAGCDKDRLIRETLTCAEWCAKQGRGHWGSANV
jgi:hypothetical protein